MTRTQELKQPIRKWLALFPDERLAALLAHAQDGKLAYVSCCCLAGAINAPHALRGQNYDFARSHEAEAITNWPEAFPAAHSYMSLGCHFNSVHDYVRDDSLRRRILIPMIRSEMWQRELRNRAVPELQQKAGVA